MKDSFLGGVVEGFYGQPWSQEQRLELLQQMADWGLNTYFYSPKDDLKHRALWRETYDDAEFESIAKLVAECQRLDLAFIYGLSPGLSIRFSDPTEVKTLQQRFCQLADIGVRHFALLFDDLPGNLTAEDHEAFSSVAAAQCFVANEILQWIRSHVDDGRLLFCPTPYCDRMVQWELGGKDYLDVIGDQLHTDIEVLWTGPEIVSETIDAASIKKLTDRIQRPPVIWDNLHANDYDLRRLYCGPYSGRSAELLSCVRGILINPNNEFHINFIPVRTLANFLSEPDAYVPRAAYLSALDEWLPQYSTIGDAIRADDLRLLADCYYLPFEEGPEGKRLYDLAHSVISSSSSDRGMEYNDFIKQYDSILRIFEGLTELKNRQLFYAWSRRVWELREELELLKSFAEGNKSEGDLLGVRSETHLPNTYRGGTVARLQRQLLMDDSGYFRSSKATAERGQR